ncbi:MAG: hypothetical protein IBX40_07570 [Methanosarcinales archaeon]|nr:hypothetical protein [Methanosarcinales archaeon]
MINANDFMYRFQTISFLIGGLLFTLMGMSGLKQLAYTPEYPGTGLILFTAFITYFGIWSLRKFYVRFQAA